MVGNFDVSKACFIADLLYQHYICSWFVVSLTKFMQLLKYEDVQMLDLLQQVQYWQKFYLWGPLQKLVCYPLFSS